VSDDVPKTEVIFKVGRKLRVEDKLIRVSRPARCFQKCRMPAFPLWQIMAGRNSSRFSMFSMPV